MPITADELREDLKNEQPPGRTPLLLDRIYFWPSQLDGRSYPGGTT